MWDNIGKKLQALAKVLCWVGIAGSVIMTIVFWAQDSRYQPTILAGFLYLIIGSLVSWVGAWAMYGLGLVVEYIENKGASQNNHIDTKKPSPNTHSMILTERNKHESSILENALNEAGIHFHKKGKKGSGLDMSLGNDFSSYLFYVAENNFEAAKDIVQDIFGPDE